jgi:hypothetical protein
MRNIFLLSTDRPSRLYHWIGNDTYKGGFRLRKLSGFCDEVSIDIKNQHIYVTSDEELKHLDHYITKIEERTIVTQRWSTNDSDYSNCKKIILTTDVDLIKDGVQAIDDEFLEWFVKNPSLEFVEIKKVFEEHWSEESGAFEISYYKIIIPKQDPLNLEKLESKLDNALSKETTESLTNWLNSKRDKQEPNFYEKLKEYFENTPREKVLEDWNKSAHLDNVGPTIDEFIENSNEERLKEASKKWSLSSAKEFALSYFKKSDEVSSKGMFTYELLLRILEAGIECGYKFGIKRQDEKRYTYDELRQIAYNAYCLGQLEEPTENKYNLWIQQFKKK